MKNTDIGSLPWPGDELVFRVTGDTDKANFFGSGQRSVQEIERVVALLGRKLDSLDSILDFGCGCGRILLWLDHLASRTSLFGSDIDARAIEWSSKNIPWARFQRNGEHPPLDYKDGQFDLVLANSVFTHLDEEHQDAWLDEFLRVLRPGGYALVTVHGDHVLELYENEETGDGARRIRETLGREGIAFIEDDNFVGGPFPDFYHSSFHAPWYIFEHWGHRFKVRAYIPKGCLGLQDFVLLERPSPGERLRPVSRNLAPAAAVGLAGREDGPVKTARQSPVQPGFRPPLSAALQLFRRAAWRLLGAAPGTSTTQESISRLFLIARQQGDRINRLESDFVEGNRRHVDTDAAPSKRASPED